MSIMLLAAAFLCGVPFGIILGMVLVWRMNVPERDPDYSDGM
jgi:predicted MFS family arabinose efflux permease